MTTPIKRLFWDIETSPNVVFAWRTGFKLTVLPHSIIKERSTICIGYKWQGDAQAHVLTWDGRQSDKVMLKTFLDVAADADELVAHNGDRYDIAWLRTRCLFHKLAPLPAYKTVDTLAWAKRLCYFNSNGLDYIAKYLGIGSKIDTDFNLWRSIVLDKDPNALAKMATYCEHDVHILEQVWERLSQIAGPKTHAGVIAGVGKWTCPHCASEDVISNRIKATAAGTIQHQMRCKKCSKFYTISEPTFTLYRKHHASRLPQPRTGPAVPDKPAA